ncbi:uncharacterized protein [Asterias amurensis]|uniref:uncharacterized protein n=1 Tax=Asterias amurensis TaxID=7602 RepID=UPI003AB6D3D6
MSAKDSKSNCKSYPVRRSLRLQPRKTATNKKKTAGSVRAKMAAHSSDLREKVIGKLRDNNGPMETLALARSLGLNTRKQINPTLYKMQQQGTILKVSDSPPKWGLKHEVTLGHESLVTGQNSPLHSSNMQCDVNETEDDMPSLEYVNNIGPGESAQRGMDGSFNLHNDAASRHTSDKRMYHQDERTVQYKSSPMRDNEQGPLFYGAAPAAAYTKGDSISEMGARGSQADLYCAPGSNDVQMGPAPSSSSSSDDMESLDQHDGVSNGLPNTPTIAEAIEFLKPSIAQPENRNNMNYKLLSALCQQKDPIHSNELAKLVGYRSKKDINPTLFGMQKQGLVRKVSESPPLWVVTHHGRQSMVSGEPSGQPQGQQRQFPKSQGGVSGSSTQQRQTQHLQQQQHQQHQQRQYQTSQHRNIRGPPMTNSNQSWQSGWVPPTPATLIQGNHNDRFQGNTNGPSMQRPVDGFQDDNAWTMDQESQPQDSTESNGAIPPSAPSEFESYQDQQHPPIPQYENRGSPQPNNDLAEQIKKALSSGDPVSTMDIALAIGCKNARDINPTVYTMQRNKLLERVKDSPPVWKLSPAGMELARSNTSPDLTAAGRPPPSPQELFQKNTSWRTSNNGQASVPNFHAQSAGNSQAMVPSHMAKGQSPMVTHSSGPVGSHNAAGATMSSEMFGAINKNPISALTEYAQSRHLPVTIEMVNQQGPPHNPRFTFCAVVGNNYFPQITSRSKKDGRREAADIALRTLIAEGSYQPKMSTGPLEASSGGSTTFYDHMAGLSHQAFNSIAANIPDNISGRKVLAALIMKTGEADKGRVISLGTGNRCVTGDMLSLEGGTVNDSHAEIITRRAFLRYLYNQLTDFKQNPENTILSERSPGQFRVKQGVTFHLYISTAPCGDGAQFSRTDAGENAEGPEGLELTGHAQHLPTFGKNIQGLLRTKMEYGEGTIPVDSSHPVQTWDGIIRGERLRTMSCSDKVARWNILGLQGALLSHFIEPIYLSSVTLGSLYHHGHLSRATCCRLSHSLETQELTTSLPSLYRINHPQLGCVTAFDPPRGTEKTKALSINWFVECPGPEVTDGTKGRIQGVVPSQLCKSTLFTEFQRVAQLYGRDDLLQAKTYHDAKGMAADFETAKKYMKESFKKGGYGVWIEKPVEEELFSL